MKKLGFAFKAPPDVQELPLYSSVVPNILDPFSPPIFNAAVCIPAPPDPLLTAGNAPPLAQAPAVVAYKDIVNSSVAVVKLGVDPEAIRAAAAVPPLDPKPPSLAVVKFALNSDQLVPSYCSILLA